MSQEAVEIVKRIRKLENFNSAYTTLNTNSLGEYMTINEEALFKALMFKEKIELSTNSKDTYILNIYANTYIYHSVFIPNKKNWLLVAKYNTFKAELSYNPNFVVYNDIVINLTDFDNIRYYRLIEDT